MFYAFIIHFNMAASFLLICLYPKFDMKDEFLNALRYRFFFIGGILSRISAEASDVLIGMLLQQIKMSIFVQHAQDKLPMS